jgi:hypothetical protein
MDQSAAEIRGCRIGTVFEGFCVKLVQRLLLGSAWLDLKTPSPCSFGPAPARRQQGLLATGYWAVVWHVARSTYVHST